MLRPLDILLELDETFDRYSEGVVGEPDFIQSLNQGLRLVIEVKSKGALSASDLVATYTRNLIELHAPSKKIQAKVHS